MAEVPKKAPETVFVLTRTSYLDDCKLRGENPSSMVFIGAYATELLVSEAHSKDQLKVVLERFGGTGDTFEDLYEKYLLGPDSEDSDEELDEEAILRDIDSGDLDLEIVFQGEFVPILYEWDIAELKVIY
jgi:hypothetical protein